MQTPPHDSRFPAHVPRWRLREKGTVRGLLFLLIVLLAILGWAGCGGGGSSSGGGPSGPTSVAVTPGKGQSLTENANLKVSARLSPDQGQGVTWSLSGPGSLTLRTLTTVMYTAPSNVTSPVYAVVIATSANDSNASAYLPITVLPVGVFGNVQPIRVDGGPVVGQVYPNGAFTSVTVCAPGTLNCNTIDGILVDTGSSGLRVLASALPSLPDLTGTGGSVNECVQFPDQSYIWGKVAVADVRIAGEVASSISIHAIADPAGAQIPSECAGSGANVGTQQALGANGILGVGVEPQDCGADCDPGKGGTPPAPAYYTCSGASCSAVFVPVLQQVTHPALFFAKDNNGVALQFPPVSGAAATVSGVLTFGIGTQTNNALGNATVFTLNPTNNFTTNVINTGQNLTFSSINSGINANSFPDGALPPCSGSRSSLFCPPLQAAITAINVGSNNAQSTIDFNVDNADTLLNNNPTAAAFSNLAGPGRAGRCPGGSLDCAFEWGLPFFYGRTVFTSISGQAVPAPAPAAPWWAYAIGFSQP